MKNRALTNEQKSEVLGRLYQAWTELPEMRLGQLLVCAAGGVPVFYIEDFAVLEAAEALAEKGTL